MRKHIITILCLCAVSRLFAQRHAASISESQQVFPTYPFSDPSPIPLLSPVYPYFRYDGFTTHAISKKWKVITLENDYIRLLVLPEIGGKIWAAIEKSTGRPFLYYNHAVKFRDIAMRGPWTSGGLEANYGIIGHTPACSTPVDYYTRTNEDGSVSCFIGTLDLLTRSYWRMEINLPKDKALFSTRSCWYNTSPLEQPYYHWMNAGLKADGNLEFIYPGNSYLGHNGEHASWPVNKDNGKQISWYRNNDFGTYKSYHVFGKYTDFAGAYWHDDNSGMVRYATHDDKPGKKLWIWGLSRQGMIWEKLLTDTDGQYIELQSGRLFNQNAEGSTLTPFKHRSFAAYGTDTWKEYWYPVSGTDGILSASEYGALNLRYDNHRLKISLCPTQSLTDTLRITAAGVTLYKKLIHLSPLHLFSDSIDLSVNPDSISLSLGNGLLSYISSPAAGNLARPLDTPADFDWSTAYAWYIKACEAIDQKNYPAAALALDSALLKEKYLLPAIVKKAELLYRNMRYAEALLLARLALSIHSDDGAANFIYGLVNLQLGNITDARDGFDIAAIDPAYRSAAYSSLARIYLTEHNLPRAAEASAKALIAQPLNMDALQLQAVVARLQGNIQLQTSTLKQLLSIDPLNHFARHESLPDPTFAAGVGGELPQETYLELGIWYASCGQTADAIHVLQLSPPVAEVRIWLASLTGQNVDPATLDPVRAFPFRSETGDLLERLIASSDHWFYKYQLALIYHDRGRIDETSKLLNACGDQPNYAPFYAFRAAVDTIHSLTDLNQAARLDPQWRYQKLLAEYLLTHGDLQTAEHITSAFYRQHPDDYIMEMLYIKTLLRNKKYAQADRLLSSLTIIPFEGATDGHQVYREVKLMQAIQYIHRHEWKKAQTFIAAARRWPENLGVGQPYPADEDTRLEDWMDHRCVSKGQGADTPPDLRDPLSLRIIKALEN